MIYFHSSHFPFSRMRILLYVRKVIRTMAEVGRGAFYMGSDLVRSIDARRSWVGVLSVTLRVWTVYPVGRALLVARGRCDLKGGTVAE